MQSVDSCWIGLRQFHIPFSLSKKEESWGYFNPPIHGIFLDLLKSHRGHDLYVSKRRNVTGQSPGANSVVDREASPNKERKATHYKTSENADKTSFMWYHTDHTSKLVACFWQKDWTQNGRGILLNETFFNAGVGTQHLFAKLRFVWTGCKRAEALTNNVTSGE